jgi:hypothetical protein
MIRSLILALLLLATSASRVHAQQTAGDSTRDSVQTPRRLPPPPRTGLTRTERIGRGAIVGALVGAAVGLTTGQQSLAGCNAQDPKCRAGGLSFNHAFVGAGVGAVVGAVAGAIWSR